MSNPVHTYILNTYDLVWFGLVLWDINHCKLSHAKSSVYIYIYIYVYIYIYIYIKCVYDLKTYFVDNFLKPLITLFVHS